MEHSVIPFVHRPGARLAGGDAEVRTDGPLVVAADSAPARIRRPLELVRVAGLTCALVLLALFGSVARNTGRGMNQDLTRLIRDIPHTIVRVIGVAGAVGVLVLPLGLIVTEVIRGRSRRTIEAILTGIAAIGVIIALDRTIRLFPTSALYRALTRLNATTTVRPLDAYFAAVVAFLTVIGLDGSPRRRGVIVTTMATYVVSTLTVAHVSLLSLVASATIGAIVGVLVRYVAGEANEQPDGLRIAAELERGGSPITSLERIPDDRSDHRTYLALSAAGTRLTVQVFDRDRIASDGFRTLYRLIRLRREITQGLTLSLERIVERRSTVAFLAAAAEAPVPRLIAAMPCGPDAVVLAYESPPLDALLNPTDAQLDEIWQGVSLLHQRRVVHQGLTADHLLVTADEHVILSIPTDGTALASDLRISVERAQLLTTCAQLAGPTRALRSARTAITEDDLLATLPVLQPVALNTVTRKALKGTPDLLEALRSEIQANTERELPDLARIERVQPRAIVSVTALLVAAYLIIGQLGSVNLTSVLTKTNWQWIPVVLLASVATYPAAALSLIGYVREKLSFTRTVLVQLAASFVGFVTPPSVGGLALNIRFLIKARLSATAAVTSVGMSQVFGAALYVVIVIACAAATGTSSAADSLPSLSLAVAAVGCAVAIALVVLTIPPLRHAVVRRALPLIHEALPRMLNLITSPIKLAEAVSGTLLLNTAYVAALWAAVRAFNGTIPLATIAVVYLAGNAVGFLAPTPGGLGAVEVALATGLAAAHMPSVAAVSAVLVFRLATFWIPVPLGWGAMKWLEHLDAI